MRWCYSKFDSLFRSHTVGVAIGVGRTHRGFAYGMGRTHGVGRTPSVGRTHGVGRTDGGGRTWWGVAQNALVLPYVWGEFSRLSVYSNVFERTQTCLSILKRV